MVEAFDRRDLSVRQLEGCLDLAWRVNEQRDLTPKQRMAFSRIPGIIEQTDILDIRPGADTPEGVGRVHMHSKDRAHAIVPGAAHLFSALPSDQRSLPLPDQRLNPSFEAVITRQVATTADRSLPNLPAPRQVHINEQSPTIYVAPLSTDEGTSAVLYGQFARVEAMTRMSSTLRGAIVDSPVERGYLAGVQLESTLRALETQNEGFRAWLDAHVGRAAMSIKQGQFPEIPNPPIETVAGRIVDDEPLIAPIVRTAVTVAGIKVVGLSRGDDPRDTDIRVYNYLTGDR